VLARAIRAQSRQSAQVFAQLGRETPSVDDDAIRSTDALLRGFELALPETERRRVSFYFTVGSQNQDLRGQTMDGEVTVVVSGFHAAAGLADLYFLMARSTWVESEPELARHVPPPTSWMRRLARLIRFAL
jgi:phosphatidylserine/phosphatidylglycerophosphate/cardiolipin synthase-like enzyme